MRELPAALQELMTGLQVGQATPPFGSLEEGVRVLVHVRPRRSAGRPGPEHANQIYGADGRAAREHARARRYLRDLRRDAVIEYR